MTEICLSRIMSNTCDISILEVLTILAKCYLFLFLFIMFIILIRRTIFFWNVQNLVELCVILHAFCVFHLSSKRNFERKRNWKHYNLSEWNILFGTCKSLSEALLFAEHEENMLCTKIVLNVRNNFCTYTTCSPRFELWIFMHWSCIELVIQWTICRHTYCGLCSWCRNRSFWQRFTCKSSQQI